MDFKTRGKECKRYLISGQILQLKTQSIMLTISVAVIYLVLLLFTILFQVGLVFGKPWGEWTMGGYNKGVLPIKIRVAPFISIIILSFFAVFVVDSSQILSTNFNFPDFIKWFIIGFNVLAVIANSATQSKKERKLWQPITVVMLLCSLVVL
jgi:hypothetical protein